GLLAGVEHAGVDVDELPLVGVGTEGELEHPELVEARVFAVGGVLGAAGPLAAPGADDELPEALRIGNLVGPLRREALVMVRVAVEHHLAARGVELVEEPARLLGVEIRAGAPPRQVRDGTERLAWALSP